jgi:gas vesicle protein
MRKTLFLIIGLLSGAVVGVVAVILFTPYSGDEVKSRIRTRFNEVYEESKRVAAARQAEMRDRWEALKRGKAIPIDKGAESDQAA